jgi:hypothetical protein
MAEPGIRLAIAACSVAWTAQPCHMSCDAWVLQTGCSNEMPFAMGRFLLATGAIALAIMVGGCGAR